MKSIITYLFIISLSINILEGQNRIIFKTDNFLDCKIRMINPDGLSISALDETNKKISYIISYEEIARIHGSLTKSQVALLKNRNPNIRFDESLLPLENVIDYSGNDYLHQYLTTVENLVPQEEIQSYYRDGELYKYYFRNGITITMNVFVEKSYGKYYVAFISIQNLTGDKFDIIPSQIRAMHMIPGGSKNAKVLTNEEYLAIVDRRQSWNTFLVAFGEAASAHNAGSSRSTTNANIQGNINNYNNYSGQIGNTTGSYQGTTNTMVNMNVNSQTTTRDGAAQYAAKQNARNNVASYNNQQFQIRENLNAGYLKRNTVFNEQNVFGHVNINYEPVKQLVVIVPIDGENYCFPWDYENEISFK